MKLFTEMKMRRTFYKAVDIWISADAGLGLMNIFVLALSDVKRIHPIRLEVALGIWLMAWLELQRRNSLIGKQGTHFSLGLFELLNPIFELHDDAIQSIVDDLSDTWSEDEADEETDQTVDAQSFISRINAAIESAKENLYPLQWELDALADGLGLAYNYRASRKKASRYFEKGFNEVWASWLG